MHDFDDQWRASEQRAADALAAVLARVKRPDPPVPTSYAGLYLSILASPHRKDWPPKVKKWAAGRVRPEGLAQLGITEWADAGEGGQE